MVEEFSKHSCEYHNPRHDGAKGNVSGTSEDMEVVLAMLNTIEQRLTKMDQSIHSKDGYLDENGNKKAQVCYSTRDKYDENWRKPKIEWFPYDE